MRGLILITLVGLVSCGDDGGSGSPHDAAVDSAVGDGGADAATPRAVDLIVVADNSAGQNAERAAFEAALQDDLVPALDTLDVDYRIILVTAHGADPSDICIGEPLGVASCGGAPAATAPFFHYSAQVNSHDGWCQVLDTFAGDQGDAFGLAPGGWKTWLRADSLKVVLYIGNDGVACDTYDDGDTAVAGNAAAALFDTAFLALDSALLGTAANRGYVWLSVVGLPASGGATTPIPTSDPVSVSTCSGAVDPGTGHQGLSVLTGGERYSWCELEGATSAMMHQIAADIAAHR